ncbi:MAG: pyrroline-5-carboxylate reductase [Chitinispirillia bacterium]
MKKNTTIALLGAGNIGISIAKGLFQSGSFLPKNITLTRRNINLLNKMKEIGFKIETRNLVAVKNSEIILLAVEPQQLDKLLEEIGSRLIPGKQTVISVVSGVSIKQISAGITKGVAIVRAMPNTAIAVRESMTCLTSEKPHGKEIQIAESIFKTVGKTLVIDEECMTAATALGACGIAFFLRAIRAASQGGIEVGFNSEDAIKIAAQTAKGAGSLLLRSEHHPEYEIDRVTTPRGCTIAGLNYMEHEGFSSAMIKGIITSAEKASNLYTGKKGK